MSIREDIELLKKAQALDKEIYDSRQLIEDAPHEIKVLENEVESERKALKAAEEALRTAQLRQKEKEASLEDKETAIRKFEGQLAQVKTNKEYALLQSEIRSLKADNSLLEESIIELLDRIDECQATVTTEQARMAAIETEAKQKKSSLEAKAKEAERKIQELSKTNEEWMKNVDPELASLYERVVRNKRGLALATIDGEVCSACQMHLRPQQINEIRLAERIAMCEQCSRILYSD